MTMMSSRQLQGDEMPAAAVLLPGDGWENDTEPDSIDPVTARRSKPAWRLFINKWFRYSALARRIVTFNLIALCVMLLGILYLSQFRGSLLQEQQAAMMSESSLVTRLLESRVSASGTPTGLSASILPQFLKSLELRDSVEVRVYDTSAALLINSAVSGTGNQTLSFRQTPGGITGGLSAVWQKIIGVMQGGGKVSDPVDSDELVRQMVSDALSGTEKVRQTTTRAGDLILAVARPVYSGGTILGAVVLSTKAGSLDQIVRAERESILRMFLLALIVSVLLSVVLAGTIANPIRDLAAAAEAGATAQIRQHDPEKVLIPDMSGRPDEIGHLSTAMRDMTAALYLRISTNEQFAADVAHEIKNPLASLRSATETLRIVSDDKNRDKLLDVVEHDVRRLDRLVSDISNASRLDAELVKEEMEPFDLTQMLDRIVDFNRAETEAVQIDLIWDKPEKPIICQGLEQRLAQVFVNLLTNAISFCEEGDAIRVWTRKRDNRILIVVEDTGPGIPENCLIKIFSRFYSERPVDSFGNHSGLGLSISKQIVEAHGGVIWAENIHGKEDGPSAPSLGARFVVGLPV
jgi:two-component system, OmpR family, sensor histidine kinase ChvG